MRHQRLFACLLGLAVAACATSPRRAEVASPPESVGPPSSFVGSAADDLDPRSLRAAGLEPRDILCNRENRWGGIAKPDSEAGADELMTRLEPYFKQLTPAEREQARARVQHDLFWRMIRTTLLDGENNNLGVVALAGLAHSDASGAQRPTLLFRSAFTPYPDRAGSCFRSLVEAGGVRHVINLFDGELPKDDLIEQESRAAKAAGATYVVVSDEGYGPWRDQLRKHYEDPAVRAEATEAVARLIREQILFPGGQPPRGNIHVHCGGGMHRTGMLVGVIERCVNHSPMEVIEARYRYHAGWRSAEKPGGAEEGNLRFIREFDCALLKTK